MTKPTLFDLFDSQENSDEIKNSNNKKIEYSIYTFFSIKDELLSIIRSD
jgi:hypothetical protein